MLATWLTAALLLVGCTTGRGEGEWRPIHQAIQDRKTVELAMAEVTQRHHANRLTPGEYGQLVILYSTWALSQAELTAAIEHWRQRSGAVTERELATALTITRRDGDAFLKAAK